MALNIIIDGYNLIGIFHRDLERERANLIKRLQKYFIIKGHRIVIVFDGHRSDKIRREIHDFNGIKTIYTKSGETADELIVSLIKDSKLQWVVVSSDHFIQKEAWSNNCIPINSKDFEEAVNKTLKEEALTHSPSTTSALTMEFDEFLEEDYSYTSITKRGNPRKLSKKQKAIMKILERL